MPATRRNYLAATAPFHIGRRAVYGLLLFTLIACGHAPPLPIDEGWVMQQVSTRYHEFFFAGPGALSPGRAVGPRARPTSVVDDSALIRSMLKAMIDAQPDMECVGVANDPYQAREIIRSLDPGEYRFFDDFHLDMPPATLIAREPASP